MSNGFTASEKCDFVKETICKFYKKFEKLFYKKKKIIFNPNYQNIKLNHKNIIFFNEPSGFLLEILSELSKENSKKFKIVVATKNKSLAEKYKNTYFITDYSLEDILYIYSKSKIILRNIRCDNRKMTPEIGAIFEFPKIKNNFLMLKSLLILKKADFINPLDLIKKWIK